MSRILDLVSLPSRRLVLVIASVLAVGCAAVAHDQCNADSAKLSRSQAGIPGRYIVVLAAGGGSHVYGQAYALALLYGGNVTSVMDQLGMFVIDIDDARVSRLADDPRVTNVSQDRKVEIQLVE
jgi:hypothetical protein